MSMVSVATGGLLLENRIFSVEPRLRFCAGDDTVPSNDLPFYGLRLCKRRPRRDSQEKSNKELYYHRNLPLYFMSLNQSNHQIAQELDLAASDVQATIEQLRTGITTKLPPVILDGDVEADEVYVVAGHNGTPAAIAKKGTPGRGKLEKEKSPILGLIQRGGEVVPHMLANVQQTTIRPIIELN
jgi:hypothetical protein